MKKLIISIMLLLPFAVMAQKGNFILKGKIGYMNAPAKIYLKNAGYEGKLIDSVFMQNGLFEFKGSVNDPIEAELYIIRKGFGTRYFTNEAITVYLERGSINVNSPDSLQKAKITGSKITADNEKLEKSLKPFRQQQNALGDETVAMNEEKRNEPATQAEIKKKYDLIFKGWNQVYYNFIKSNPNSYLSLILLKKIDDLEHPSNNELIKLFNTFSNAVKQTKQGNAYWTKLKKTRSYESINTIKVSVGQKALDFSLKDPEGNLTKLSDFRGKYVLVDFWESSCGPCRGSNPYLVKAYEKYHDQGFEILGVSLDSKKAEWLSAVKKDNLTWKQVSDLKGWKNVAAVLYGVKAIPRMLLIDPNGIVISSDIFRLNLDEDLGKIFNH